VCLGGFPHEARQVVWGEFAEPTGVAVHRCQYPRYERGGGDRVEQPRLLVKVRILDVPEELDQEVPDVLAEVRLLPQSVELPVVEARVSAPEIVQSGP
jgi:hypothetical protein